MVASSPMPSADRRAGYRAIILAHMIRKKLGAETGGASCVDGPRLARDHLACSTEVACSHVSGLLVQSGWTAGPDGVREPRPHHSSGIDVPMKRQVWLGCVGIDRLCHHASLLSRKLQNVAHSITSSAGASGANQPFSSRLSSLRNRQSVASAMILLGSDLIMPASRSRSP